MDLTIDPLLAAVGLLIGVLVGSTGIGGLLLAPSVNLMAGVPLQTAIPACVVTFIFTGTVGTMIYGRKNSIAWDELLPLTLGAGPAAFLGAFILTKLPGTGVQLIIAVLAIWSGSYALLDRRQRQSTTRNLRRSVLTTVGAAAGFFSAITGTGGPLVLLPMLFLLGVPVLQAIGLSQAIQIPIGILATSGNATFGAIEIQLVAPVAATVVLGATVGALTAHYLPKRFLTIGVALVMIAVGFGYGFNAI